MSIYGPLEEALHIPWVIQAALLTALLLAGVAVVVRRQIAAAGGGIVPDEGGNDVFVHVTALEAAGIPSIDEGDKITFDIEDDQRGRGKQATNVQLAQ